MNEPNKMKSPSDFINFKELNNQYIKINNFSSKI